MAKQVENGSGGSRSRADWEQLVAAYERRMVTRRAFCVEAGVAPSTLDYWRRKLKDEGSGTAGFIELAGGGEADRSGWEVELTLGDGMVLRLSRR
jgi:transposase-like protein